MHSTVKARGGAEKSEFGMDVVRRGHGDAPNKA